MSHRCHLFEMAFVWELTKETIHLPLGCLQGGYPIPFDSTPTNKREPLQALFFFFLITLEPRVE